MAADFRRVYVASGKQKNIEFPAELKRIDTYLSRHFEDFLAKNPVDFTNAGSQYVKSKPGSFQALRKEFGALARKSEYLKSNDFCQKNFETWKKKNLLLIRSRFPLLEYLSLFSDQFCSLL